MKKSICIMVAFICIILSACGNNANIVIGGSDEPTAVLLSENGEKFMYKQITQAEAKKIMDSEEAHVVLDVREQDEYDTGHIPGAILIPHTEIDTKAAEKLPDKGAQILVYCRTGRRSKLAAESLARLGYTNVKEFGGITDWKYETEK